MRHVTLLGMALLLTACSEGPGADNGIELYHRARTLYIQGDLSGARALLESGSVDRMPAARVLLGRALFFQGEEAAAAAVLADLLEEAPHHVDAAKWLARSYLAGGDPARARGTLTRALEVSSEDPELLLLMGRSARELGDTDQAIEYFSKAAALAPRLAAVHLELAEIYRAAGISEEALRHLRRAEAVLGETQ